eukprot:913850-Pleurochrysis_carterae.AAC.6
MLRRTHKAEVGKALDVRTNRSKKQQAALASTDALACGAAYDGKELRARGDGSVASKRKEMRAAFDETCSGIVDAKIEGTFGCTSGC